MTGPEPWARELFPSVLRVNTLTAMPKEWGREGAGVLSLGKETGPEDVNSLRMPRGSV